MSGLERVAHNGDRLETLRALRDYLAKALDGASSGRDQAALAQRLADVLAQISELEPPKEVARDPLADLVATPHGSSAA